MLRCDLRSLLPFFCLDCIFVYLPVFPVLIVTLHCFFLLNFRFFPLLVKRDLVLFSHSYNKLFFCFGTKREIGYFHSILLHHILFLLYQDIR